MLSRTEQRQAKKAKCQRTEEYETAIKTKIVDDGILRELNVDLTKLQQKKFDSLVRQGIIVPEDMSFIFNPMNGINWIEDNDGKATAARYGFSGSVRHATR